MTLPAPDTLDRERDKLFVTDAELIRWMGVPEKLARELIAKFEAHHGFPKKQALYGDRRYKPAVRAWFDRQQGLLQFYLNPQAGGL